MEKGDGGKHGKMQKVKRVKTMGKGKTGNIEI